MKNYKYLIERPVFQDILSLVIAILIFTFTLVNYAAQPIRTMGIKVDSGFASTIPAIVLILYLAYKLPGGWGKTLSLTLTLLFFGLTLVGLWGTGQSQSTVISGLIPYTDAANYYIDSLRLMLGQEFSEFSARRPLFPALMSVLLWLSDRNLMVVLSIWAGINGLSCYLLTQEIKRTHGPLVAVFVLVILLLFYRLYSGTVMSEQVGVSLGVLGFAIIWRGITNQSMRMVLWGLFISTLALNARVGALFTLPAIIIWGSYVFAEDHKKFSLRFFMLGMTILIMGFAVNLLITRILAKPQGVPFANFSYSLYGEAAGGKGWAFVRAQHPELRSLQEPELSRTIYKLAFELIRENPKLFLQGALLNWSKFFTSPWYGAYSYVGGENLTQNIIVQRILMFLCILGIAKWALNISDPHSSLVIMSGLGVVLSVPFAPPGDTSNLRAYAASLVSLAMLPGLGLYLILAKYNFLLPTLSVEKSKDSNLIFSFSYVYCVCMLICPLILSAIAPSSLIFSEPACPSNFDSAVVRLDKGNSITIVDNGFPSKDAVPNFHWGWFTRELHGMSGTVRNWQQILHPQNSLFLTINYRNYRRIIIVIPAEMMPIPGSFVEFCGKVKPSSNLFFVHSFRILEVH